MDWWLSEFARSTSTSIGQYKYSIGQRVERVSGTVQYSTVLLYRPHLYGLFYFCRHQAKLTPKSTLDKGRSLS